MWREHFEEMRGNTVFMILGRTEIEEDSRKERTIADGMIATEMDI